MNWRTTPALLALLALLAPLHAFGSVLSALPIPAERACRPAIEAAERAHGIPQHLLAAIARVESGRRDTVNGGLNPWPWTINKDGQGSFYDVKSQAISAAAAMRPHVRVSIDVGCMQISLTQHPDAFATLEEAFDPVTNAEYGARFLVSLYDKTGSWPKAVAAYHSATPGLGDEYQAKVYAALPREQKLASETVATPMRLASLPTNPLASAFNRGSLLSALPQAMPRIIPQASSQVTGQGGSVAMGRTLDQYRSMPVRMAYRMP